MTLSDPIGDGMYEVPGARLRQMTDDIRRLVAENDRLLAEVDRLTQENARLQPVPGIDFALAVLDDKEEDERRLNARLRPPGPGDVP